MSGMKTVIVRCYSGMEAEGEADVREARETYEEEDLRWQALLPRVPCAR